MRGFGTWIVAVALLLAGCSTVPSSAPPAPAPGFIDPIDPYHDHTDAADHALWTPSVERLAYHPLGPMGTPFRYIGEIDAHEDLALVAIEGGKAFPQDVSGFVTVNVADPRDPVVLGRGEAPWSTGHDIKFSTDGSLAFQGTQYGAAPPPGSHLGDPRSAYNNGVIVWDLSDPNQPSIASFAPVEPAGCHMLSVGIVAGSEYVFCAPIADLLRVFRVDGAASTPVLVPVGVYDPPASVRALNPGPHDMTFQPDPLTGRPVLVVSYVAAGLRLVDVSDPANPVDLGGWSGEGAQHYFGQIHSAMSFELQDRRIIVATPELYTNETPALFFLDATDAGAMVLLREWVNPGGHNAFFFALTTHQIQVVADRVYLSYNHAGVWVLNATKILSGQHGVEGYYLPHEQAFPVGAEGYLVPHVWDVVVHRGAILASDRETGLYLLNYAHDVVGDAGASSFA